MEKILTSSRKVRFQDCDPFNHLNNSRYLDYFLNAREDQLLDYYGFDIFDIAKTKGLGWVISSSQILYLNPAYTMENIVINSQLFAYTNKSLAVEMRMYNADQSKLKSILWTSFIHFDLKAQKPAEHHSEFMNLFAEVVCPINQTAIEERRNFLVKNGVLPKPAAE